MVQNPKGKTDCQAGLKLRKTESDVSEKGKVKNSKFCFSIKALKTKMSNDYQNQLFFGTLKLT